MPVTSFFSSNVVTVNHLGADHTVRPIAEPGAVVPKAEKKETRKELPEMAEKMAERQKKKEEKKQKIEGVKEKAKK